MCLPLKKTAVLVATIQEKKHKNIVRVQNDKIEALAYNETLGNSWWLIIGISSFKKYH